MKIGQMTFHFYKRQHRKSMSNYERCGMDLSVKELKELDFIKRQLVNSKGAICALCGKPIKDMNDLTIDHIKPRSLGGETSLENCQLAHYKCNQNKANLFSK